MSAAAIEELKRVVDRAARLDALHKLAAKLYAEIEPFRRMHQGGPTIMEGEGYTWYLAHRMVLEEIAEIQGADRP